MEKEQLRPVTVGSISQKRGFFHRWFVQVFNDEPGCEHPYALVEMEDGQVKEISATEMRFTDRS